MNKLPQEHKEDELLSIPELGKLYRFIEMPDNKRRLNRMDIIPINETNSFTPKDNRYWSGKCCYILNEYKDEDWIRVIVCHEMFFFKKDYRIFKTRRRYLEDAKQTYLMAKQREKLDERNSFVNSNRFKRLMNKISGMK